MLPVCHAVTERKSIHTFLCLCVSECEVLIVNSGIDVSLVPWPRVKPAMLLRTYREGGREGGDENIRNVCSLKTLSCD